MPITGNEIFGTSAVRKDARELPPPRFSLRDEAFYGVAGEFVRTILPHTESDPAVLLLNLLTGFGSMIGRGAYFQVEGAKHFCNLFVAQVGESSKGRKGTGWNRAERIFELVDPNWVKERVQKGLSSGEGLISAAAFSSIKEEDPRLMVMQPEFASALTVMARQGNTLSAIIREAWDGGRLQIMVKREPVKINDAHISLISHITKEELCRHLNSTETANGFANRFLWISSERSKCLPDGGAETDYEDRLLAERLRLSVEFGKKFRRVQRDEEAGYFWKEIYYDLWVGRPGLSGAVTSRGESQVLRLSLVYAVLDCSPVIRLPHLLAAVAVWHYAEQSADWIFGDAQGNSIADAILAALRTNKEGLTRTQISGVFAGHHKANQIAVALDLLASQGLAIKAIQSTGGRNVERWTASPPANNAK